MTLSVIGMQLVPHAIVFEIDNFRLRRQGMHTMAVVLDKPKRIRFDRLALVEPKPEDVVVQISYSGLSSGTERKLWDGTMPDFPGMGYPLVPGYESIGQVVAAGADSGLTEGDSVFVPGARCYQEAHGLFGGAAATLIVPGVRALKIQSKAGKEYILLALAATALHALHGLSSGSRLLIVGHGVLGRLVARIAVLKGLSPVVWERNGKRLDGGVGYHVIHPEDDEGGNYSLVCDVSGDSSLFDRLISRLCPGGELILAGFYGERVSFGFTPAFMRELRLRIAAQWQPKELQQVQEWVADGSLSLAGLITHTFPAEQASDAYITAFTSSDCLKMVLDWRQYS
jgi:3-hydroxyethyl bacteriochlorophyllide a dehydrogenase